MSERGETRQLFGIPFHKDKLETDITEYEIFIQQSNKKKRFFPYSFHLTECSDKLTELILC